MHVPRTQIGNTLRDMAEESALNVAEKESLRKIAGCYDQTMAENNRLSGALEKIVAEGEKPDTQAAADEGLGPNPHTMADIAEKVLKGE